MSEQLQPDRASIVKDEISLIDLLVVFLRRRRLILICTLLALILGTAAVLILPERKYQKRVANRNYEAIVNCRPSSAVQNLLEPEEFEQMVLLTLTDPVNILKALKTAKINWVADIKINGREDYELLFALDQRLVKNRDKNGNEIPPIYTCHKVRGSYRVSLKHQKADLAKQFVIAMVDVANEQLVRLIIPEAEAEIETFELTSNINYPRQVIEENLQSAYERYSSAIRIVSGEDKVFISVQNPYVLIPTIDIKDIRQDILKKTVIVVVGVFFLSVLLAFLLQWVETVRKDPESMAKIRRALGKEKK